MRAYRPAHRARRAAQRRAAQAPRPPPSWNTSGGSHDEQSQFRPDRGQPGARPRAEVHARRGRRSATSSLASNRYFKQDEETQKEVSFFEVTTWSRLAEVCGEYLKKGRGVRVVGRLKQDRWTSPEGQGRSKVSIVAEHVEFKPQLKSKDGDGKDDGAPRPGQGREGRRRADQGGGRAQGGGELLSNLSIVGYRGSLGCRSPGLMAKPPEQVHLGALPTCLSCRNSDLTRRGSCVIYRTARTHGSTDSCRLPRPSFPTPAQIIQPSTPMASATGPAISMPIGIPRLMALVTSDMTFPMFSWGRFF